MEEISKIDEIIQEHFDPHRFLATGSYEIVQDVMKEYAEWYAKECLEIAARNVCVLDDPWSMKNGNWIDKSAILNIELPPHK